MRIRGRARQSLTRCKIAYSEDILTEYIVRLENDFGVSVNQAALNQVIGGGAQQ